MKKRFNVKSILESNILKEMMQEIACNKGDTVPDYDPFVYYSDLSKHVRRLLQVLKEEKRSEEYKYINEYYMKIATGKYLLGYDEKPLDDFQRFAIERRCPPVFECFCEWLNDLFGIEQKRSQYIVKWIKRIYNDSGKYTNIIYCKWNSFAYSVPDALKKFNEEFSNVPDEDILSVEFFNEAE